MAFTGYRLYRGVGGLANVDWSATVGTVSGAGASKDLVGLGHLANTKYTYAIRAVYVDMESPDVSAVVEVAMDGSAEWVGNKPEQVRFLELSQSSSGNIVLRWDYISGTTAATTFGIYYQKNPIFVTGSPTTTEAYTTDKEYTKTITGLDADATYWFAITASSVTSVESPLIQQGPIVAKSTAPDAPTITASAVFGL